MGGGTFFTGQPIQHPHQVHGSGGYQVLEVHFIQTPVTGAAHSQHPDRLRDVPSMPARFL